MARVTQQHVNDRRDTIIAAAEKLFADAGFAATSMADIVKASGVATGTVYRYFDSKEAIVMAATERVMGIDLASGEGPPPALPEAVRALVDAAGDERRSQLSSQVWAKAAGSPQLRALIAERHARIRVTLARSLDGTGSPQPGPQALRDADIIICAVSGVQQRVAAGVPMDLESFAAALISQFQEKP